MKQVKCFCEDSWEDIEHKVNKWLSSNNVEILQVSNLSSCGECVVVILFEIIKV